MIDHTGFSVTNLEDSKLFYTSVLASLGHIARLEIPMKGQIREARSGSHRARPPHPECILPSVQKTKRKWTHSTLPPSGSVEKIMVHRDTGLNIILDITPRLSLILMGTILRLFTTRHDNDSRLGSVWITSGYASFIK